MANLMEREPGLNWYYNFDKELDFASTSCAALKSRLGVSLLEKCTQGKLRIAEYRICSSKTAILNAGKEEEY